jgi:hypothetical protein
MCDKVHHIGIVNFRITTLNSLISVGGELAWETISVGHTNFLVKVELIKV